jgi:hypothetical protein
VKCSSCARPMGSVGFVVTLVSAGRTYTATVHDYCMQALVGHANERRLTRLTLESGWEQSELPGFASV